MCFLHVIIMSYGGPSDRTSRLQPCSPPLQLQEKAAPSHSLHKPLFHYSIKVAEQ